VEGSALGGSVDGFDGELALVGGAAGAQCYTSGQTQRCDQTTTPE